MSRNSSGTYTLPVGNPVVSGTVIEASWANGTLSDIAAALTDSLSRSGQGGMTSSLRIIDGSASVPSLAFANETGSGAYRAAAGDWYLTVLGNNIARFRASGVTITGDIGATTATISGSATIGGLSAGSTSITGALGVTGNATIGGTLGVSSNATVGGYLDVSGFVRSKSSVGGILNLDSTIAGTTNTLGSYSNNGGNFADLYVSAAQHLFVVSGTECMRINTAGNVGIGTIAPSTKLHVYGGSDTKITSQSSTNSGGQFVSTNSAGSYTFGVTGSTTGDFLVYDNYANQTMYLIARNAGSPYHLWFTGGVAQAALNTVGGFVVGNGGYSAYGASYGTISAVASNGATIMLQPTPSALYSARIWMPNSNQVYFDNNGVATYVFSSGNGSNYSTVNAIINNVSDRRLKENISPLTEALDRIDLLKPVEFSFKEDVKPAMPWGTALVDGFLADEFGDVIVGGTYGEKDAVDADGNIVPQQIDMTRAIPLMVAAIQELKAEVDALKAAAK